MVTRNRKGETGTTEGRGREKKEDRGGIVTQTDNGGGKSNMVATR